MSENDHKAASFELPDRFWAKVDKSGDWWVWTAARTQDGHPQFRRGNRMVLATRLLMQSMGYDISGLVVRHSCDNPPCLNPEHLIIGTQYDNIQDRVDRGRNGDIKGMKHPNSKFHDNDVVELRRKYDALPRYPSGMIKRGALPLLCDELGINYETARGIGSRRAWKHL